MMVRVNRIHIMESALSKGMYCYYNVTYQHQGTPRTCNDLCVDSIHIRVRTVVDGPQVCSGQS